MEMLAIFILGFSFNYIIHTIEVLSQLFESKIALKITKINSQIGEWSNSSIRVEPYSESEYNDFINGYEDEEDYID